MRRVVSMLGVLLVVSSAASPAAASPKAKLRHWVAHVERPTMSQIRSDRAAITSDPSQSTCQTLTIDAADANAELPDAPNRAVNRYWHKALHEYVRAGSACSGYYTAHSDDAPLSGSGYSEHCSTAAIWVNEMNRAIAKALG